MNQVVWITGIGGFSGRHMTRHLKNLETKPMIVGLGLLPGFDDDIDLYIQLDITNPGDLLNLAAKFPPTHVIHLAGLMPGAEERDLWHTNVGGTLNLLRSLTVAGCSGCRIVIIGSAAEYIKGENGYFSEDSPSGGENVYGITKWAQTTLALEYGKTVGLCVMVGRTFNLMGPGLPRSLVAGELCSQFADERKELILGKTTSERDFIDIRDAVGAYWKLAESGKSGQVYNVCSGNYTKISELVKILSEITGKNPQITHDATKQRKVDLDRVYGSNIKIKEHTGWSPAISIRESLADMLEAIRVGKIN